MSLAHVVETDGKLIISQTNGPALRNFRNSLVQLSGAAVLIVSYFLFPGIAGSFDPSGEDNSVLVSFVLFSSLAFLLYFFFQSINRLFGKETFKFDKNEGVFIRNGFTVGPLSGIRAVTAQVTASQGQYVMFRLILELPRCGTVTIVRTHDVPAEGQFHLSGNGFGDPNKRFAICEPWLDYDEQDLVPFLPPEIAALRQKILEYVGVK